jgi:hypothetical protein
VSKIKKDNLLKNERDKALNYINTLLEVAREPFLILNRDLIVVSASASFYQTFQVSPGTTEGKFVYDLGNKQWNIPKLRKLLEDILPKKKVIKDFEVKHNFQHIGTRTILLNARQVDSVKLIILAFEDITEKKAAEEEAKKYTGKLEKEVSKRTKILNDRVKDLEELTNAMVGRELKMSELKKELERVRKRKGFNNNHNKENNS